MSDMEDSVQSFAKRVSSYNKRVENAFNWNCRIGNIFAAKLPFCGALCKVFAQFAIDQNLAKKFLQLSVVTDDIASQSVDCDHSPHFVITSEAFSKCV